MAIDSDPWQVFGYEEWMWNETLRCLLRGGLQPFPAFARNAIIESLLLHTRILVEILLSRDKDPDGIRLKTLLPKFDSPRIAELNSAYGTTNLPGSPCQEINKRLAHATERRADGQGHDWTPVLKKLVPIVEPLLVEVGKAKAAP